jgi:NAD(P)-dependent dehydrogenase (short-subunit alcohol dehydrogenase family)
LAGGRFSGSLKGQTVLVTGAGTGIGRAAAVAFAEAGASMALCGRRPGPLEETVAQAREFGGKVTAQSVDVGDEAAVTRWVTDAIETYGRIDVLANCAGTNTPDRTWADTKSVSWHEIIDTNLTGIYNCSRAVLPTMREQRGGLIINISSISGVMTSSVAGVAYSASKYGVVSLTGTLNAEEWTNGIRATCVCPGEVATPIMDKRPNPPPASAHPLMIQPADLGETLVFLATLPPRVVVEQIIVRPLVRRF